MAKALETWSPEVIEEALTTDVASANSEELRAALPGFAGALEWPDREDAPLPD